MNGDYLKMRIDEYVAKYVKPEAQDIALRYARATLMGVKLDLTDFEWSLINEAFQRKCN